MNEDPARGRFFLIQMMRLSGVVFAVLGLAIINGAFDLPKIVGYIVFVIGLVDALFMPTILSRMWKSPRE